MLRNAEPYPHPVVFGGGHRDQTVGDRRPGSVCARAAHLHVTRIALAAPPDYTPRGRRDPFTPIRAAEEPTRDGSILASAKLTGIVRGSEGTLALVETIDGTGFILRAGEGFGEGRLLDIGEDFALFDVRSRAASTPRRIVLRLEPRS